MNRTIEKWRGLAPWERQVLIELLFLLPLIGLSLRLAGYRRTRGVLARRLRPKRRPRPHPQPPDLPQRAARLVSIAAYRGAWQASCLRRALALWWLLGRRGIDTEIRFGVRPAAEGVQAHAWVERGGEVLEYPHGHAGDYRRLDSVTAAGDGVRR